MYSSALYIANQALVGSGFMPIASAAQFALGLGAVPGGTQGNSLDKYQQVAVTFLNLLGKAQGLVFNKRALWRRFQITTVANQPQYKINNQIIEGFRANSFFNVTVGGAGNMLHVWTYQDFMMQNARPDVIPFGTPLAVVPIPEDGSGNCVIQLWPTPDQAYIIEGQSRLLVPDLVDGNSFVFLPKHYEHALIFRLIELLETKTNEGKEASARLYAQQFWDEVYRDASGADEEIEPTDPGFRLWGNWRRETARDYNPVTDVPGPYP